MPNQVILRKPREGFAEIAAGALKGYNTGQQQRQQSQRAALSDALNEQKLQEYQRQQQLAGAFESGQQKAPDGFIYDALQQKLVPIPKKSSMEAYYDQVLAGNIPDPLTNSGSFGGQQGYGRANVPTQNQIPPGAVGVDAQGNFVDAQGNPLGRAS